MVIARLNSQLEEQQLNKAISFGLDQLTRPYDNWEIIRIMLRILFRKGKGNGIKVISAPNWYVMRMPNQACSLK